MKNKSNNKKNKKLIRYSKPKRAFKEAFGNSHIIEKKLNSKKYNKTKEKDDFIITNTKNNKDILKYDLKDLYSSITIKSNNIIFKNNDLNNQIYEEAFFDLIEIKGDGNYLFRTISYYIYRSK